MSDEGEKLIGVIVVNGYYKSASYTYQVDRLREEFSKKNVTVSIYENNLPQIKGKTFFNCDFVVFLDKDVNFARWLEKDSIRVFNSAESIDIADNKIKTYVKLSAYDDIGMPKTVFSPKQYQYVYDEIFLNETSNILGFPLVIKTACGSLGCQVYKADDFRQLSETDKVLGANEKIYQEFIKDSEGESLRVIVIGGEAIGAIKIVNKSDFRSNAFLGGKGKNHRLTSEEKTLAENVARRLNLDYCGVDLFCHKPMLIEVNSNAYFSEFEKITGINVAEKYVEYILGKI